MNGPHVLMAPDWRAHNPYLRALSAALEAQGVRVSFPYGTKRGLPLTRMLTATQPDWLHVHWPEAFWARGSKFTRRLRILRFPFDLALANRRVRLACTVHNLTPHDEPADWLVRRNMKAMLARSSAVFVHSAAALRELEATYGSVGRRAHVVPHGDLLPVGTEPPERQAARAALGLPADEAGFLMFGVIRPYKGILEIVKAWKQFPPTWHLWIVGPPDDSPYFAAIQREAVALGARIRIVAERIDDPTLVQWIAAADAALFNYRRIFTSGAACLARSVGTPLLMPAHCRTADVGEPSAQVLRFDGLGDDLTATLRRALQTRRDPASRAAWCEATAWSRVAALTSAAYRSTSS